MKAELNRLLRKYVFLDITYKNRKIALVKQQEFEDAGFWRDLEKTNMISLAEVIELIKKENITPIV